MRIQEILIVYLNLFFNSSVLTGAVSSSSTTDKTRSVAEYLDLLFGIFLVLIFFLMNLFKLFLFLMYFYKAKMLVLR